MQDSSARATLNLAEQHVAPTGLRLLNNPFFYKTYAPTGAGAAHALFLLCAVAVAADIAAQTAGRRSKGRGKAKQQNVVAKEQEKQAQATTSVEFSGQQAFKKKKICVRR